MSGIDFNPLFVSLFRIRIVCGAANAIPPLRVANLGAQESAGAIIFQNEKKLYAAATTPEGLQVIRNFQGNCRKSPYMKAMTSQDY